jgi:hypothetical protein
VILIESSRANVPVSAPDGSTHASNMDTSSAQLQERRLIGRLHQSQTRCTAATSSAPRRQSPSDQVVFCLGIANLSRLSAALLIAFCALSIGQQLYTLKNIGHIATDSDYQERTRQALALEDTLLREGKQHVVFSSDVQYLETWYYSRHPDSYECITDEDRWSGQPSRRGSSTWSSLAPPARYGSGGATTSSYLCRHVIPPTDWKTLSACSYRSRGISMPPSQQPRSW